MSQWREPIPWACEVDRIKAIVLHTLDLAHGDDEQAKQRHIRALLEWPLLREEGRQALTELLEAEEA